jgi:hypothetical protein
MLEIQSPTSSSTEVKDEGYSPPPLFITPYISRVPLGSLPRSLSRVFSPLSPTLPFLPFLQDYVWHEFARPW